MVVGIDARELCNRPAGKGQYLARLITLWYEQALFPMVFYIQADQEFPAKYLPEGEGRPPIKIVKQKGKGPLWHRAVGRRLVDDGVTVFFAALSYQSAIWNQAPTVSVVHDLAIFKLPSLAHNRKSQIVERLTLEACVERSKRIISVSENTRKDIVQITGISEDSITVIPVASMLTERMGGKDLAPLPRDARKGFILFVGTLEPRKNIANLIKAYAELPENLRTSYHLKLAGKIGWGGEDYPSLVSKLGLADQVEFTGYLTDEQLFDFYREATLLAYPSWYEGFGMPPLEAMSVGTPVVTSDRSSLPEVVGNTAALCDPSDTLSIRQAIETVLCNPKRYAEMSRAGFERAKQFNWEAISKEVADVLRSVSTK